MSTTIPIMSGYPLVMLPKTTNLGFGGFSSEAFKDVTVSKTGEFNGIEKSRWLSGEFKGSGNSYDFGARIYDSRLGRWLSLDPLQSEYPGLSAYNFVANSPLVHIDPNGKNIIITRKPNEGTDGKDLIIIQVTAKWVDKTSKKQSLEASRSKLATINPKKSGKIKSMSERLEKEEIKYREFVKTEINKFKADLEASYSGSSKDLEWRMEVDIEEAKGDEDIGKSDHVFYAVDDVFDAQARVNRIGGLALYYAPASSAVKNASNEYVHEQGHLFGLLHIETGYFSQNYLDIYKTTANLIAHHSHLFDKENAMWSGSLDVGGAKIEEFQILLMERFYNESCLNQEENTYQNDHGHNGGVDNSHSEEYRINLETK